MHEVQVGRVYDRASPSDGRRVLVDRLWPRGLSKEAARIDEWLKAVAPSDGLRRWYGHQPGRFAEFRHRYADELGEPERAQALAHLQELARSGPVVLLTASKDVARSHAAYLAQGMRLEADATEVGERGGDAPCWLKRVCQQCGAIADADPPTICPQCHEAIPGDA